MRREVARTPTTALGPADNINREPIDSSNIISIGYAPEREMLAVEFKSRAIFHYRGVSLELMTAFYCAPSRGTFYAKHIKGKFSAQKMTGPCDNCAIPGVISTRCEECHAGTYREEDKRHGEPTDSGAPAAQVEL